MNWLFKQSSFTYNGKKVTRRKATFDGVLGHFEVHEAVNGNSFVRHPKVGLGEGYPVQGLGLDEWFGAAKRKVADFEAGIKECEGIMSKMKQIVSAY